MKKLSLLIILAAISLRLAAQDPVLTPKQTSLLIDSIGKAFGRYYIFEDKAAVMVQFLKSQLKKGAYSKITNPYALADRLGSDMQKVHRDPHMGIRYDPEFAKGEKPSFHQQNDDYKRQLKHLQENNFFFERVDILPDNIGYLKFNAFSHMVKQSRPTLNAAFTFLKHTKLMIIDLRDNHGGSPDMVRQIESYFFTERAHMMDIVDRPARLTRELWADPADADSLTFQGPVYILTGTGTFSGAEDFSYGMQSIHRATIIGDTTGGGAHPTGAFNIGQGFVAAIPFARSLNPYTKTDWEGTGVRPDVPVTASRALEQALEFWYTQQLSKAATEKEKLRIQWSLDNVKATYSPEPVTPESLSRYIGIYQGGLDFYVDRGRFYCKNAERANEVFELKAVSSTRFVLDENVIVEFTTNPSGAYSGLDMRWGDGEVSKKSREK